MSEIERIETVAGSARLRRRNRRTLGISVHPDGSIELAAPQRATVEEIQAKVKKRESWIRRQQRAFAAMNAKRRVRRFCSGATHRYLGRQYRLKLTRGVSPEVKLVGGFFRVTTKLSSEIEVAALLDSWIRERAKEQFARRVERWQEWCQRQRLPVPRVILRSMQKRWGSAHRDGRIALNPDLVRAPSVCIDYVIIHEICHLKHPNHGPEFFHLLDQLMPGWQKVKARLEAAEL